MKLHKLGLAALASTLLFSLISLGEQTSQTQQISSQGNKGSVQPFLDRWDLTLYTPGRTYASWLELTQDGGQLQGRMVGRWGHAHPLLNVQVQDSKLSFSSPKKEEATSTDMQFQATLVKGNLSGTVMVAGGRVWRWTGQRAPLLNRSGSPTWGKPIDLFNGKNTKGWWFTKPDAADSWQVKDGILITSGSGSEIITTRKFRDFKLHVEFNCEANCNSGVYLRGRYEVQIAADSDRASPNRSVGAVYGFLTPSPRIPLQLGKWHTYDITLVGRTVTVVQDGQSVIDQQEIPGITGGALDSHEGLPGPIYLQGSERAGATSYRNLVITPATE